MSKKHTICTIEEREKIYEYLPRDLVYQLSKTKTECTYVMEDLESGIGPYTGYPVKHITYFMKSNNKNTKVKLFPIIVSKYSSKMDSLVQISIHLDINI